MNPKFVTLQELVQWGLIGILSLILLSLLLSTMMRRKRMSRVRKLRRQCAQCGLWEEIGPRQPKFGVCQVCGGVTSRGRSRKLG